MRSLTERGTDARHRQWQHPVAVVGSEHDFGRLQGHVQGLRPAAPNDPAAAGPRGPAPRDAPI
eukprot:1151595-Pelagomonas_calceolata.AAC.3